jgi:F0F1-type ATP synthase delta subunit
MTYIQTIGKKGSKKKIDVITAHRIPDPSFLEKIEKRLGNESEVRLYTDEKIRGGIHIKDHAQNKQFDGSIASQLEKLHKTISK